jgi:hypothetical protein
VHHTLGASAVRRVPSRWLPDRQRLHPERQQAGGRGTPQGRRQALGAPSRRSTDPVANRRVYGGRRPGHASAHDFGLRPSSGDVRGGEPAIPGPLQHPIDYAPPPPPPLTVTLAQPAAPPPTPARRGKSVVNGRPTALHPLETLRLPAERPPQSPSCVISHKTQPPTRLNKAVDKTGILV